MLRLFGYFNKAIFKSTKDWDYFMIFKNYIGVTLGWQINAANTYKY